MPYGLTWLLCGLLFLSGCGFAKGPRWVGKGNHRILVEVEPAGLGARNSDESSTCIEMSAAELGKRAGAAGKIDVASIQVERYDASGGQPVRYGKWAYAQDDWELPFRWYDASIPEDFPEFDGNIDKTGGQLRYHNYRNWGYFYESLGEWDTGRLAWIHTQDGNRPSYYAIYFDFLPKDSMPDTVPRRGYLGDGLERTVETGPTTDGLRIGRVEAVDWNGDGLIDLLLGGERGGMVWFPNRGTRTQPRYPYPKLMFTADGKPLDVGFSSTPLAVDWDGDGVQDLLSGAEWNRVIWYKNTGTNGAPKLEFRGFVGADDQPLRIPHEPNPEIKGIYKTDYHPVLAVADLHGEGRPDLFAAGYVTGMIFRFRNMGLGKDDVPTLKFVGPLEADGKPIDTQWGAAPTFGDFDGDGDLDLISGSFPMTAEGGDSASSENYLYYFENTGTPGNPRFRRRPFPLNGKFHRGSLATPRAADLNSDGLLDLVVSEGSNLFIFMNRGTAHAPLWEYNPRHVEGRWNTAVIWGQPVDWNHDGHFDLVQDFSVLLNEGKGNPQLFGPPQDILPERETIFHKSPTGDQWTFTQACDLDSDGKIDIVYGVHEGNVYVHRNLGSGDRRHFDTEGVLLKTVDGRPVKVGPQPGQPWDFDVLQGARTTLTCADYGNDGKMDLVVGDTYGKVRYFGNISGGTNPAFAQPVLIADAKTRLVPTTSDWNGDGWPDVLVGSAGGRILVVLNSGKPGVPRFLPATELQVPRVPFGSTVIAVDWNEDGDMDLVNLASYGYLCWYDRSFLEHGYAHARINKFESRAR